MSSSGSRNIGTCEVPAQEVYSGFCYDACEAGWSPYSGQCLKDCPAKFVDHGQTCEPPSVLRKPVKAYMTPCAEGQVDVNGDCYEPQIATWHNNVTGCGCIRKKLVDRLQCPDGYELYNNSCVTKCPEGYQNTLTPEGRIGSLYCHAKCPYKEDATARWPFIGGLCVKEFKQRTRHELVHTDSLGEPVYRVRLSAPVSAMSVLAKRASSMGSLNRYETGGIFDGLIPDALNPAKAFDSVVDSFLEPLKKVGFILLGAVLLFTVGIPLLKGAGTLIGGVTKGLSSAAAGAGAGIGSVAAGTGSLLKSAEETVGKVAKGAGGVIEAAEGVGASLLRNSAAKTDQGTAARDLRARMASLAQEAQYSPYAYQAYNALLPN